MSKANIGVLLFFIFLFSCTPKENKEIVESEKVTAFALDGTPLHAAPPSSALMEKLDEKKQIFDSDSNDVINVIWYGRFKAYSGDYNEAIDIFTNGIKRFPEEARLYRHRGHRYITIRMFDKAIEDLEKAASLIANQENAMEPDGMPNKMNIPVSSTHGNIWYHLGLAYYLNHDFENSLSAYVKCLETSKSPDNVVSATHWIYMILNRLGRKDEASSYLSAPSIKMSVIENLAYQDLCLFYMGEKEESDLLKVDGALQSNDAVLYGLGNFHYCNGNQERAVEIWSKILESSSWNSFGYIASESEKYHMKK